MSDDIIDRLLAGDEQAFEALIDAYHGQMVRVARAYVTDETAAEEVVQETWAAMLDGLRDFKGDSSLKTWLFAILTNQAKKRGKRDAREPNWSSISEEGLSDELADDGQFDSDGRFENDAHWSSAPGDWRSDPEQEMMRSHLRDELIDAIESLPARQQVVLTLRDVHGWSPDEVCEVLDISNGNHRVLLHRAREKVREEMAPHLTDETS
jgi:RNA polymerase sigma-70 factor (ECF subfamily)